MWVNYQRLTLKSKIFKIGHVKGLRSTHFQWNFSCLFFERANFSGFWGPALVRFQIFCKIINFLCILKVLSSFWFPKSIPDNLSASTMQWQWEICKFSGSFFSCLKLEAKKTKVTTNWNCIRLQFCDPLNWIVNFEQPEKLAKKVPRLRSVYFIRLHILWTLIDQIWKIRIKNQSVTKEPSPSCPSIMDTNHYVK